MARNARGRSPATSAGRSGSPTASTPAQDDSARPSLRAAIHGSPLKTDGSRPRFEVVDARALGNPELVVISADRDLLRICAEAAAITGHELRSDLAGRDAVRAAISRAHSAVLVDLDHPFDHEHLDPAGTLLLLNAVAGASRLRVAAHARHRAERTTRIAAAYGATIIVAPLTESSVVAWLESPHDSADQR